MKFSQKHIILDLRRRDHKPGLGWLDIFKFIGPALLVTVGFIDPGNWTSNQAAGNDYRYELLVIVKLSIIMLIILQYNEAHLRIFVICNLFKGLIYSQILLSLQLPVTVFNLIYHTSSCDVISNYTNSKPLTFPLLQKG